eukprot:SAG11_NODE_639_length_8017_cov_4.086259_5_plen_60_part_00
MLLKFATGRIRLPVQLKVQWAGDPEKLPTSATCYQTVYLPPYTTVELMKEKILVACVLC